MKAIVQYCDVITGLLLFVLPFCGHGCGAVHSCGRWAIRTKVRYQEETCGLKTTFWCRTGRAGAGRSGD